MVSALRNGRPPGGAALGLGETVMNERTKIILDESEMPTQWYNVVPDLPEPPPPVLHPGRMDPVGPEDLAPLFPMALILQEVSQDRYIDIPEAVQDPQVVARGMIVEVRGDGPTGRFAAVATRSPAGPPRRRRAARRTGAAGRTTRASPGRSRGGRHAPPGRRGRRRCRST